MPINMDLCTLLPIPAEDPASCFVTKSEDGKWKTTSFYVDSYGIARISLPLELTFSSVEARQQYLDRGCVVPRPSNSSDEEKTEDEEKSKKKKDSIAVEARVSLTYGTGEAMAVTIDSVEVMSTSIKEESTSIVLYSMITIRIAGTESETTDPSVFTQVKANLEISAVFSETLPTVDYGAEALSILSEMNLIGSKMSPEKQVASSLKVKKCKTTPFVLHTSFSDALVVDVRSVPGPEMGETFLSVSIQHSGTHSEPITITRLALHSSLSRENTAEEQSRTKKARGLPTPCNTLRWNFAPRSNPNLPVTLRRDEAISTILRVESRADKQCRNLVCPLSVTAYIADELSPFRHELTIDAKAEYNSFKSIDEKDMLVNLSLEEPSKCLVGAPMTVKVEVQNLGNDARHIELMIDAADYRGGDAKEIGPDGFERAIKKDDLVLMDTSCVIGKIQSQCSSVAKLRMIPMKEGTVHIPNMVLHDTKNDFTFSCFHKLRADVQPRAEQVQR